MIQEICSVNSLHVQSLQQLHQCRVDVIQDTQYMTIIDFTNKNSKGQKDGLLHTHKGIYHP